MIQGWTVLQPSVRERRLWATAMAAAAASAVILAYGALALDPRRPGLTWGAAALIVAAAVGVVIVRRRTMRHSLELRIDAGGIPWVRPESSAGGPVDESAARAVFVAPWLITLQANATLVAVWPDSLPTEAFRRLHACVRWARAGPLPPPDPRFQAIDDRPVD